LDSTDKPTGSLTPLSLPSLPVSKKPDKQNAKHALATEKTDAKQDAAHGNEKPQDKDTEEKAESRLPDEAKDTEVSGTDEGHAAEENASSTSEDFQVMDSDDENELNERGDNEPEDAKATFDVPTAEADLYTSISEEQGTAHLTRYMHNLTHVLCVSVIILCLLCCCTLQTRLGEDFCTESVRDSTLPGDSRARRTFLEGAPGTNGTGRNPLSS
jgi:hypothetical protein